MEKVGKLQGGFIMVKLYDEGVYLVNGRELIPAAEAEAGRVKQLTGKPADRKQAREETIAYHILKAHNHSGNMEKLRLRFDAMASHDITFVGIIQTAKASGMERFPLPYVLTNCHNSLCAVGGTINEDDHMFGLSAARKYGGIYVPPHIAVIHQFMRESFAGCGQMILGSDSHTRYGALGTMAIGEGGGELVKQLLEDTYDIPYPGVIAVYLEGKPAPYVGPQDIALAIIGAVFQKGYVKNKVMEFVGPGIAGLSTDFRNGIDVMTTETTCLSSIWQTDEDTKNYLEIHKRGNAYRKLEPGSVAYYDGCVYVDLSQIRPMIALPFHPSNVYTIDELNHNLREILKGVEQEADRIAGRKHSMALAEKITDRGLQVQQGIIAGCAGGTYTNVVEAARLLKGRDIGNGAFSLSVYPSSQPVFISLSRQGLTADLMEAGAIIRTAFCGPCFGAGDTPCNDGLSIRHTTRNFPNREGSKPGANQMSGVALMDARSIAATAANQGILTSAEQYADAFGQVSEPAFDDTVYKNRVYFGYRSAKPESHLVYGPNIKNWPDMEPLSEHILLQVCSKILDPVTTTDELIPSGETSSYRSNPLGLAEFTLSRRDPGYVGRAKATAKLEALRQSAAEQKGTGQGKDDSGTGQLHERQKAAEASSEPGVAALQEAYRVIKELRPEVDPAGMEIGSMIYAVKPGDGSAREQAASCQRVLGGLANVAKEYATKRYRSNVINWGMLPFQMKETPNFSVGDFLFVPSVRDALNDLTKPICAYVIRNGGNYEEISLYLADMTEEEREIVKAGCLINYNRARAEKRRESLKSAACIGE